MEGKPNPDGFHGNHAEHHHLYPPGSYVDVKSTGKDAHTALRVRCTLQEDHTVHLVGDAELVKNLQQGFSAPFYGRPEFVTPKDGVVFLLGLQVQLDSPYLYADEIKRQDAHPDTSL